MPYDEVKTFYAYEQRRVGAGLAIGIFLVPAIFAWFLLRSGYTPLARILSFGWLGLQVLGVFAGAITSSEGVNASPSTASTFSSTQKAEEIEQARKVEAEARAKKEEAEREEAQTYASAKDAVNSVRYSLADPDSALFKDVWAVRGQIAGAPEGVFACGSVNAKNAFGGYIGYMPFVAVGSTVLTPQDGIFERVFRQVCLDGKKLFPVQI